MCVSLQNYVKKVELYAIMVEFISDKIRERTLDRDMFYLLCANLGLKLYC